jgi:HSP20 family protein
MTQVRFNSRPIEKAFNNFFDDLFTNGPVVYKSGSTNQWNGLVPVNINESEGNYNIDVIAPGFDKSDIKINIDQNVLTISGEKKAEEKPGNEKEIRKEYSYRSFKRSFTLDEKIDAAAIEAKYVNGVLTLNLPKKAAVKEATKEITIQ